MYTWETLREKWSPHRGLEFRIKYHLNRERGEACRSLRGECMIFRKDKLVLRRANGRAAAAAKSLQSCLTPCDPMDCNLPGCSVHRILQASILEWVVMPSSRGSARPGDRTYVSLCLQYWQAGSLPKDKVVSRYDPMDCSTLSWRHLGSPGSIWQLVTKSDCGVNSSLSCDVSILPVWWKLLGKEVGVWQLSSKQIGEHVSLHLLFFTAHSVHSNQYTKVPCFGVAYSASLQGAEGRKEEHGTGSHARAWAPFVGTCSPDPRNREPHAVLLCVCLSGQEHLCWQQQ